MGLLLEGDSPSFGIVVRVRENLTLFQHHVTMAGFFPGLLYADQVLQIGNC